ncbi:MAG: hypothetical protein H0X67_03785 [Acidobacteria bacterium]|nr:hypothetical protein [Acidobacteriota bacterium]
MLTALIERTREEGEQTLQNEELGRTQAGLTELGLTRDHCVDLLRTVTEAPSSLGGARALRGQLLQAQGEPPAGAFERVLLLHAFLASLDRLADAPLAESVKRLFCEEVRLAVVPPPGAAHRYDINRNTFVAFCKTATLRRFPAGQLHWELSGFPRSWLLQVNPRSLPQFLYCLIVRMRGLRPVYFIHLNANRKDRAVLLERESNRSYFRMAQSLALQPHVRGLIASSWLHSPDTMAVSPHLSALNRVFLENGALVTTMGPADLESGVFHRSPERKRMYEQGTFRPTTGLVLWPRADMLAWAAAHPELAD